MTAPRMVLSKFYKTWRGCFVREQLVKLTGGGVGMHIELWTR